MFSVTWITVARITAAHFTVADFTDPTKKCLPNLPLPNFPVAQFSIAHFTVAQFTVYLSTAFDTVDHNTLLQWLRKSYCLGGKVMVYVVSQQQKAASSHDIQFGAIGSSLQSVTRLGPRTDLVSTLHCRPAAAR